MKTLALKIPQIKRLWDDRLSLISERDSLTAKLVAANSENSPFYHYMSSFDAIEVMKRHARKALLPAPNHRTNFLGVKISPKSFPGILDGTEGSVEPVPIPANWHADIAEWAAALRAVDLAKGTFRVIELGCGWGCWLLNTGAAARHAGLKVDLIGIEGDGEHVKLAHQSMADNGFKENDYRIIHGIAAGQKGKALFPVVDNAGAKWGSEPIFNASTKQVEDAAETGSHDILDTYPISELSDGKIVDLLHIDIQGGETDFVESCLGEINRYVRYIVIGTHSRAIEGKLMEIMLAAGWRLEMERAAIIRIDGGSPQITVDGVQGWRNPTL
jgi:hypothetical protein